MGLFDSVKDRLLGVADQFKKDEPDQRYFDEYENAYPRDEALEGESYEALRDEEGTFASASYAQGTYGQGGYGQEGRAQVDGQTQQFSVLNSGAGARPAFGSRPPQESVSVYTRSGRLVDDAQPSPSEGSFTTAESFYTEMAPVQSAEATGYISKGSSSRAVTETTSSRSFARTTGDTYFQTPAPADNRTSGGVPQLTAIPRPSSGKLPPYSIKPTSYDDAQLVARRVQTNQPVVISLRNTPLDTAKRMLDFCFGFTYGIGGKVQEIASRTFVVLPAGMELTEEDIEKIKRENSVN